VKPRTLSVFAAVLIASTPQLHPSVVYSVRAGRDVRASRLVDHGVVALEAGKLVEARRSFDRAIQIDPTMWPAYFNRAGVFCEQKKWEAAVRDFDTTIRIKPSFYVTTIMRGSTFAHLGRYERSLADFDRVLSLHPIESTRAMAFNARAWLRATCPNESFRNGREAVADAKAACNITLWRKAGYIDTLAAAYAEAGDFDSAVKFENRVIALDSNEKEVPGSKERLAAFQHHQPIREGSG
jgi:tetratricopeptide (TPR) repeat protein